MTDVRNNTAIALGFFDGVHIGHQAVIAKAVELADREGLVPGVFTFAPGKTMPESKSGCRTITSEEEKERVLHALGVREIFCPPFERFQKMTGEEFVRDLLVREYHAQAVCCGYDFRFGKGARWTAGDLAGFCAQHGVSLTVVPAVLCQGQPVSSTRIRDALGQGDMDAVNRMLGRRYSFDFPVVHGRHLGRTINSPTINQPFPQDYALPRFGVYASFAVVEGKAYPAVTNIGVKPTVEQDSAPLAETYILGIDQDLYGQRVEVYPVEFLRPETRFGSVEELKEHIQRDANSAERVCRDMEPPAPRAL